MKFKNLTKKVFGTNIYYPKGGEVFQAKKDVKITYLTHFMAPYTGGAKANIFENERVIVSKPLNPKPKGYYCYPINAYEIEKRIIPKSDRNNPKYNGFSLSIDTKSLNTDFKQIELKPIEYIKGDATNPSDDKPKIIVHICNDIGGWGKGFVMAISKKWKDPENEYRKWFKNKIGETTENVDYQSILPKDDYSNHTEFKLGNVQFVKISSDLWIANMIAQHKIRKNENGLPPIRYPFVSECLERVREFAKKENANIHMPRIGCGLAGGEWNKIEEIINSQLIEHEIETTVYDFE
ncbi:macro domain-containing protein [Flagellimonas flava]|uniref:macro domain-containing protein n=1 Tax=Flagellimonas flava TaxID=570519 RepID=UPI003D647694